MSIKKTIKIPADSLVASDWHYGHNKDFLVLPRGFTTREQHRDYIKHHIALIPEDKTLVFCGDLVLTSSQEELRDLLSAIKCKVYMIWGNHNGYISAVYKEAVMGQYGRDDIEVYPIAHPSYPNITFLGDTASFKVRGHKDVIMASHFPQWVWDHESKGSIQVCGHSHGNCPKTNGVDRTSGKVMDVGVEMSQVHNDGKPYMTFEQVFDYMKDIPIAKKDHH